MAPDDPTPRADNGPPSRFEVEQGLKYTHLVGECLRNEVVGCSSATYALVDLLIAKGVLSYSELEEQRALAQARVRQQLEVIPGLEFGPDTDKYDPALGSPVNCAERLPVCKGLCCRLRFPLSVQDLDEGLLRWDYLVPYRAAKGEDGRCVHQAADHSCGAYEHRPAACRIFDCRDDERIWIDFERWILNPDLERLGLEPYEPA